MTITFFFPPQWTAMHGQDWVEEHRDQLIDICHVFRTVFYFGCFAACDDGGILLQWEEEAMPCPVCGHNHAGTDVGETTTTIRCLHCGFEVEAIGGHEEAKRLSELAYQIVTSASVKS